MTGCSPTRLYCSLWHSQRDALKPCLRILSPFFSLPSSLPLFHKSTHHFYVLYEHSTPSWHLKTFPHPLKNTLREHLSKQCAPISSLFPPQGGRIRPAVSLGLYKRQNIHMHTSLSPSLCWPISKKEHFFFCTLKFATFMRAGGVPMQGKHNDSSWGRAHTWRNTQSKELK